MCGGSKRGWRGSKAPQWGRRQLKVLGRGGGGSSACLSGLSPLGYIVKSLSSCSDSRESLSVIVFTLHILEISLLRFHLKLPVKIISVVLLWMEQAPSLILLIFMQSWTWPAIADILKPWLFHSICLYTTFSAWSFYPVFLLPPYISFLWAFNPE